MIEAGIAAIAAYLALIAFASWAGITLAHRAPWRPEAWRVGLPEAAGILLGAFLVGLAGVLALAALPRQPAWVHLLAVLVLLAIFPLWRSVARYAERPGQKEAVNGHCYQPVLRLLMVVWMIGLLLACLFLPLAQNDALEYMTVGRILFEARDLAAYPAIHPEREPSGFYGPWTHPPLYVAHIYLANLVQGHAEFPGVARAVAPWFMLAAVAGVVALGRLRDGLTALLAGLMLLSTPLVFLGAASSLIDALPIAAVTLLLVFLVGLKPGWKASIWLGVALGFALWTHSQGLLILILGLGLIVVISGLTQRRQWSAQAALAAGVAAIIGGWPYVRNVMLFGSPVSDNPAVFAYEPLDWAGYFSYGRGLDHIVAIIQYGLFKGWLAWESYAGVFWVALGALLWFAWRLRVTAIWQRLRGSEQGPRQAVLWLAAWLLVGYYMGLAASLALRLDWMIRNERYLLIVMPAVALWAASGLCALLGWIKRAADSWQRKWHALAAHGALGGLIAAMAAQWVFVAVIYPFAPVINLRNQNRGFDAFREERSFGEEILDARGDTAIARLVSKVVPETGRVLSLHPATMYYAKRRMLSYLDPAMLDVYALQKKAQAIEKLIAMGVTHIHSVEYGLPPRTNSVLHDLLADPAYTSLLAERDGFQLYALKPTETRPSTVQDLTPGSRPWQRFRTLRLLGRKSGTGWILDRASFAGGRSIASQPLFHRDYSTMLLTGHGLPGRIQDSVGEIQIDDAGEYRLDLYLVGEGNVRVWVWIFDQSGRLLIPRARLLGERVVRPGLSVEWHQRFLVPEGGRYLQMGIEHIGRSNLEIRSAQLVHFGKKP